MQTATPESTRPATRRAVTSHHRDPCLSKYLDELDSVELLKGERETTAALQLRALKLQYWRRLLLVRGLESAIFEVVGPLLEGRMPAEVRWVPDAPRGGEGDASFESMLDALVDADPSCELADRIAADVHALASGEEPSCLNVARRPRRDRLRHHSAQLSASRSAWARARGEFTAANLRLVVTMARRYAANGRLSLADLIQDGNLGLMTAVDRFDPRRGFRFSTYGAWWIRHAISRALSDTGRTVRLPVHVIELQLKLAKSKREFEKNHQRSPDTAELATVAGVPLDKVERLDRVLRDQGVPLPDDADDGRPRTTIALADASIDSASLMHQGRLQDELLRALGELKPAQLDILRKRFGLGGDEALTLREVGEAYSLSRERIRQLQEGALSTLRRALEKVGFERSDASDDLVA